MSSKSKNQLRTENSTNFPNNNSQFITPERLRNFNSDVIDSMLINEDSGSYLVTSSFDTGSRVQTFTREDGTTYTNLIPGGGTSDTGSLLVTASVVDATITYTKGDGSVFTNTINNVVSASYAVSSSRADSSLLADSATSASHAENADVVPYSGITDKPTLVSGSSQVSYPELSNLPGGIVSGSVITAIVGGTDIDANTVSGVTTINNAMVTGSVARTNENNTFSGNQTFNDITVNGTGSFAYISSVTGSSKTIGDAFIILNNDTPTLRYAGLKVQDSGSASPTTASLQYDGGLNDWFFEKEVSGVAEFGVVLGGPEYTALGVPTYNTNNTIPKGTGGHHLNDSNITDNGTTITLGSATNVSGPLSASNLESIEISNLESTASVDRDRINQLSVETGSIETEQVVQNNQLSNIEQTTASLQSEIDGLSNASASYINTGSTFQTKNSHLVQAIDAPANSSQKNFIQVTDATTGGIAYDNVSFAMQNYPSFGRTYEDTFLFEMYNSFAYNYGTEMALNGGEWHAITTATGSGNSGFIRLRDDYNGNADFDVHANAINIGTFGGVRQANQGIFIGRDSVDTTINNANLNINGQTNFAASSKILISGSTRNHVTPLTINSETASIDFAVGSMFELTLVSGSTTHITQTNSESGQTLNMLVTQPSTGTGSISFQPGFFQPTGSVYVPTPKSQAQDILTFITFGTNSQNIYTSAVNEMEFIN